MIYTVAIAWLHFSEYNGTGGSCKIGRLIPAVVIDYNYPFDRWMISEICNGVSNTSFIVIGGERNNNMPVGDRFQRWRKRTPAPAWKEKSKICGCQY
jgi:hypothetical protein